MINFKVKKMHKVKGMQNADLQNAQSVDSFSIDSFSIKTIKTIKNIRNAAAIVAIELLLEGAMITGAFAKSTSIPAATSIRTAISGVPVVENYTNIFHISDPELKEKIATSVKNCITTENCIQRIYDLTKDSGILGINYAGSRHSDSLVDVMLADENQFGLNTADEVYGKKYALCQDMAYLFVGAFREALKEVAKQTPKISDSVKAVFELGIYHKYLPFHACAGIIVKGKIKDEWKYKKFNDDKNFRKKTLEHLKIQDDSDLCMIIVDLTKTEGGISPVPGIVIPLTDIKSISDYYAVKANEYYLARKKCKIMSQMFSLPASSITLSMADLPGDEIREFEEIVEASISLNRANWRAMANKSLIEVERGNIKQAVEFFAFSYLSFEKEVGEFDIFYFHIQASNVANMIYQKIVEKLKTSDGDEKRKLIESLVSLVKIQKPLVGLNEALFKKVDDNITAAGKNYSEVDEETKSLIEQHEKIEKILQQMEKTIEEYKN